MHYLYDYGKKKFFFLRVFKEEENSRQKCVYFKDEILVVAVLKPRISDLMVFNTNTRRCLKAINVDRMCPNSENHLFKFFKLEGEKVPYFMEYSRNEVYCKVYCLKKAHIAWKYCLSEEHIYKNPNSKKINFTEKNLDSIIDDVQW